MLGDCRGPRISIVQSRNTIQQARVTGEPAAVGPDGSNILVRYPYQRCSLSGVSIRQPAAAAYYQSLVPGSELVVFEQSAHLTMHDEPDHYNAVLRDFLRRVENQRKP